MAEAAESGAVIAPPVPAFYTQPATVADIVDHTVARALDQLGVHTTVAPRWTGRQVGAGTQDGPAPVVRLGTGSNQSSSY
jgi:4-hydroxy-3-polyprenylbenzoate decarboxylase